MRILFLGTHGQKNWGDELLLKTFMDQLSPLADTIYVNSYAPAETQAYLQDYNVQVFNTSTDRFKLLFYLLRSDAVVFGGGSVLKELYTAYGGERYATLHVINTLTRAAKLLGKPIYFCNIGVGPLETGQGLALTRGIVNRATQTTVRDSESFKTLGSINALSPYQLSSDAVFSVNRIGLGLADKKQPAKTASPLTIGVNLCRNIENNDNWPYFIAQLANDLSEWCTAHPNSRIVGIPMQSAVSNNNDTTELKSLAKAVHHKSPTANFTIAQADSIKDIARAIDACDVVLAERLHTLILSTIIGTPVVALEYDIKVTSVMKDIGLGKYGVNINERFKTGSILALLTRVVGQKEAAQTDLTQAYSFAHHIAVSSFEDLADQLKSIGK